LVAGTREAADRTGSTVHEIGDRAYDDETTPLEPGTLFGLGINALPYADQIPKNARQHCTTPPSSTSDDARLDPRLITDEYTETLSYGLVAEPLEQTGEKHAHLSRLHCWLPSARDYASVERTAAYSTLPYVCRADNYIWLNRILLRHSVVSVRP
jgi:hypothetical protein